MKFNPPPKKVEKLPRIDLADGQSVQGVFRGDIYEFYQHWGVAKYPIECTRNTPTGCEHCKTDKGSYRFRVNFITEENGEWVAKHFEQGRRVYAQLGKIHEKKNLEKVLVEVSRAGAGQQDTTYMIMVQEQLPDGHPALKVPLLPVSTFDIEASADVDEPQF